MMDTQCFYFVFAPPWATPWPHLILFGAYTFNTDVKVSIQIGIWLLWFVLQPTRWVTSLQNKMMDTQCFCFIGAPPWATSWPHITLILAWTMNTTHVAWFVDSDSCPIHHLWPVSNITSQNNDSEQFLLHLCTSMGDPCTPWENFFWLEPLLWMS